MYHPHQHLQANAAASNAPQMAAKGGLNADVLVPPLLKDDEELLPPVATHSKPEFTAKMQFA